MPETRVGGLEFSFCNLLPKQIFLFSKMLKSKGNFKLNILNFNDQFYIGH